MLNLNVYVTIKCISSCVNNSFFMDFKLEMNDEHVNSEARERKKNDANTCQPCDFDQKKATTNNYTVCVCVCCALRFFFSSPIVMKSIKFLWCLHNRYSCCIQPTVDRGFCRKYNNQQCDEFVLKYFHVYQIREEPKRISISMLKKNESGLKVEEDIFVQKMNAYKHIKYQRITQIHSRLIWSNEPTTPPPPPPLHRIEEFL